MAHIEKYKAHSVGHMLAHYRRDESSLGRENIDRTRVKNDMVVAHYTNKDGKLVVGRVAPREGEPNWGTVERRIERVNEAQKAAGKRATRKDAVVMADVVVTLPENVRKGDEDRFFRLTYWYLSRKFGIDNMMGGFVHRDEVRKDGSPVRDHMHVPFTPIVDGRFNYKKMCPRAFYKSLHKELGDYLERAMGYRPRVELSEEERTERVYTDKAKDIDAVRKAVEDKTADARAELAEVEGALAQKAEERDGIQVQIDQCKAHQAEEGAKLGAMRAEVKEKQGLAADLSREIEEKTAARDGLDAEIADFSEKRNAAADRLEEVRRDLGEVESIAQAGVPELVKRTAGTGDGERERAAAAENQALRARLAALEKERGELGERERAARSRGVELGERRAGVLARLGGLRGRLDDAWADLVAAAVRVKNYVFEQVGCLKWVFDELGLTAYEGMAPLADRGYDLDSESRDMWAASEELERSWEPPAPSHGCAR